MASAVGCTFVLSMVKNGFKVTKSKLFFRVIAHKVCSVSWSPKPHKQIQLLNQRTIYLNLPIPCTDRCGQRFSDPCSRWNTENTGRIFIQIKIACGGTVILFQRLPLLPSILSFYCGKSIGVAGEIYCSPPFLVCMSCLNVGIAFLCFHLCE